MTAPALPALPEIQRLLAEATPGPWTISSLDKRVVCGPLDRDGDDVLVARVHSSDRSMVHTPSLYGVPGKGTGKANAALIAALRTAAPALIEERRQMREMVDLLLPAIKSIATGCHTYGTVTRTMERSDMMTLAWETLKAARSAALIEAARERDEIRALAERLARALHEFSAAVHWWWADDHDDGPEIREKFSRAEERAQIVLSSARSAGLIETAPGHTDLMISPEGIDEALRQAAPETEDKGR